MAGFSIRVYALFFALLICLCSVSTVVSIENVTEKEGESIGHRLSRVTSSPSVRKYFGGALLGSAFAATVQPFKNAKDHFLVWDFKTSSRRGIFIAMKHIAHEHGILSLFKGITLSTLIFAPLFAVVAGNYELIKEYGEKVVKLVQKDNSPEAVAKREADAAAKAEVAAKAKAEKEANAAQVKAEQEKKATEAKKKTEDELKKKEEAKMATAKAKQSQEAAKRAEEGAKKAEEDAMKAAADDAKAKVALAEEAVTIEKLAKTEDPLPSEVESANEEAATENVGEDVEGTSGESEEIQASA